VHISQKPASMLNNSAFKPGFKKLTGISREFSCCRTYISVGDRPLSSAAANIQITVLLNRFRGSYILIAVSLVSTTCAGISSELLRRGGNLNPLKLRLCPAREPRAPVRGFSGHNKPN